MNVNYTKQPYIETKVSLNLIRLKFGYSRRRYRYDPLGRRLTSEFNA